MEDRFLILDPELAQGTLIRRYQRFLADIETADGQKLTIHCPNTGSMKNCLAPGAPLWYSTALNPKRKYPNTWEIATTPAGHLAGINTARANHLVREALLSGHLPGLPKADSLRSEVAYGEERSRIDFVAQVGAQSHYIEVKNVTLCEDDGAGFFPDSVSTRGARHLRELAVLARTGHRAMLVYCVQHSGIKRVSAATHIDPGYAQALAAARAAGVTVLAFKAKLSPREIVLTESVPVICASASDIRGALM